MEDWKSLVVGPTCSILNTLAVVDRVGIQFALVLDEQGHLLGTVTDGDVRRGLLKGISLEDPISRVMNPNPIVAQPQADDQQILEVMKAVRRRHIPIVDEQRRVTGLRTLDELLQETAGPSWVVLMAGGIGSRLMPLTEDTPKPLLEVGERPILETILVGFREQGFRNFFISVHYRASMIEDYFGDGSKWDAEVRYLREDQQLGTAGALSLLPEPPDLPIIVMNGDLLTKVRYKQILEFHREQRAMATMAVRDYSFQVPFGVVTTEQERIIGIHEKPVRQFFVNAGIYVLEPAVLKLIPPNTRFDMPDLFHRLLEEGLRTVAFPVREYWRDIGRMDDFLMASGEYGGHFK